MPEPLWALTLLQPWAWAICRRGKTIENRSWRPPASLLMQRFAIHAGKSTTDLCNPEVRDFIEDRTEGALWTPDEIQLGAVVGTARLINVVSDSTNPWFVGPRGWMLEDVFELPVPVPCRGAQGLWRLPDDVASQVLAQEGARAA